MESKQLDRAKLVRAAMDVAQDQFDPQTIPLIVFGEYWAAQIMRDPEWVTRNPITVGLVLAVYNAV